MYVRPSIKHAGQRFAAIDVGSNSVHLLVARVSKSGHMEILDSEKITVRLGEELKPDGRISRAGISRTVDAIKRMAEIVAPYECEIRAVATYAVREAINQKELIDTVFRATKIKIDVIDGLEEARLIFLGMRYGLPLERQACLGVDIGGGSTEIIIAKGDKIQFVTSLKLGAVTLSTEDFLGRNPTDRRIKKVCDYINLRIVSLANDLKNIKFRRAIASSGTAKAIANIHARVYHKKVLVDENGYRFSSEDLAKITKNLERLKSPKLIREQTRIDASRSEIILAGSLILNSIATVFGVPSWQVTTFGLREGVIVDSFHRKHPSYFGEANDIRWQSVVEFGDRAQIRIDYAQRVSTLALLVFDQMIMKVFPKISRSTAAHWRDLLAMAAYLTEVGRFINASGFHKHSYYMIYNGHLMGLTEFERHFVGLLVRYHRKSIPDKKHVEIQSLSNDEFDMLKALSGMIRMSAAMNRTRRGLVKHVKLRFFGKGVTVMLRTTRGSKAYGELQQLQNEAMALKSCLGYRLNFVVENS